METAIGSLFYCETTKTNCLEFLQQDRDIYFDYNTQMSGQTSMMAQDKAETSLMTLTEQSQNSRLKDEAARCKINLLTQRGLFQGSITRFKKNIRNFHWLEENGLSVQKLSLEIGESYDKPCIELVQLVNERSRFIRMAVILKEPQP